MEAQAKQTFVIYFFAFLIPLFSCQEVSLANRVVGGEEAPEEYAPYQASIRDGSNLHYCGGSIIDQYWILTAAHCVIGEDPLNTTVVVGTNSRSVGGDRYQALLSIPHPGYQPETTNSTMNDIALLRTQNPIQFRQGVKAVPLGFQPIVAGTRPVIITGWGRLAYEGDRPDLLQVLSSRVISAQECRNELVNVSRIFDSHICTRNDEGQGACSGDSGGPVVYNDTLIGVISWGFECARGAPDVHSNVFYFYKWITDNMRVSTKQNNNAPSAKLQIQTDRLSSSPIPSQSIPSPQNRPVPISNYQTSNSARNSNLPVSNHQNSDTRKNSKVPESNSQNLDNRRSSNTPGINYQISDDIPVSNVPKSNNQYSVNTRNSNLPQGNYQNSDNRRKPITQESNYQTSDQTSDNRRNSNVPVSSYQHYNNTRNSNLSHNNHQSNPNVQDYNDPKVNYQSSSNRRTTNSPESSNQNYDNRRNSNVAESNHQTSGNRRNSNVHLSSDQTSDNRRNSNIPESRDQNYDNTRNSNLSENNRRSNPNAQDRKVPKINYQNSDNRRNTNLPQSDNENSDNRRNSNVPAINYQDFDNFENFDNTRNSNSYDHHTIFQKLRENAFGSDPTEENSSNSKHKYSSNHENNHLRKHFFDFPTSDDSQNSYYKHNVFRRHPDIFY